MRRREPFLRGWHLGQSGLTEPVPLIAAFG